MKSLGWSSFAIVVSLLAGGASLSCSASSAPSNEDPAAACADITIDRFKELTIVDEAVINDARTLNGPSGVWSFRHAVENMAPPGSDPGQFVYDWFTEWVTATSLNGYSLDQPNEPRGPVMHASVLCPWAKSTPSNACNDDCSSCAVSPPKLDLAKAPFRLVAVVNRMDVREEAGIGPLGEARLVFALTRGAADDGAAKSPPMPMTVIFEYAVPTQLASLKDWAQTWHHLGTHSAFDETFKAELESVTEKYVKRGAAPGAPNGSALSQARTNESVLDWIWQLREFQIGADGKMHLHSLRNTPAQALNNSPQLAQFIKQNNEAIRANHYLVPEEMLAGSADQLQYRWQFPDIDETSRQAFARNTCNGCHSEGLNPSIDTAFHVSPFKTGIEKLSPFVNSKTDPSHDDLARRQASMQRALCGK